MLAWQVERIHVLTENQKQLPDPTELLMTLGGRRKKPGQTSVEIRNVLHILSEQYQIPIKYH